MIAGLVPLVVASILFVAFVVSVNRPGEPWLAGTFPPAAASYSLHALRAFNPAVATDYVTAQHIELANALLNAGLIIALAIAGLRRFQKWSWYAILVTFSWLGVNDAWAMIAAHQPPVPLIPISVGIAGLLVARSAIFAPRAEAAQAAASSAP